MESGKINGVVVNENQRYGNLYVGPVAVALFSKGVPPKVNAMMVSVYYLEYCRGRLLPGSDSRWYPTYENLHRANRFG